MINDMIIKYFHIFSISKFQNFDISKEIPDYSNEETRSCVYVPTNAF